MNLRNVFGKAATSIALASMLGTAIKEAEAGHTYLSCDPNPPADNVTNYQFLWTEPNTLNFTNIFDAGTSTRILIPWLEDGALYHFKVRAQNSAHTSPDSEIIYGTVVNANGRLDGVDGPGNGILEDQPADDVIIASNESGSATIFAKGGDDRILAYNNLHTFYARGQGGQDSIFCSNNPDSYNNVNGGAHSDFIRVMGGSSSISGGDPDPNTGIEHIDIISYGWDALLEDSAHSLTNFNLMAVNDSWTINQNPGNPAILNQVGDIIQLGCVLQFDPNNIHNTVRLEHSKGTADAVLLVKPEGNGGHISTYFNFIRLVGFAAQNPGPVDAQGRMTMIDRRTGAPITAQSLYNQGNISITPEPMLANQ